MTTVIPSLASVESLRATITTSADPTGGAVSWQATAVGTAPSSGAAWIAGSWSGAYANSQATTVSPLIAALSITTVGTWRLWVRWTVGSETVIRIAGDLRVTGA
jgi:hypothetical protein